MTTKLEPPLVPPLSAEQRARLHDRVMLSPVRRTPRRWAVPVAAVTAVAAVIAGATLAAHRGDNTAPPITSTPVPDAIKVDLGPASPAELAKVQRNCPTSPTQRTEVLWSRKVRWFSTFMENEKLTGVVALLRVSPPGENPGLVFCTASGGHGHAASDFAWSLQPTPAQGLVTIDELTHVLIGSPVGGGTSTTYEETWGLHRVRPEIARIQSRTIGAIGPAWYEGVVLDGVAYTDNFADRGASGRTEFRAFDKYGNPVPLP
ncbi:hypothetical protein EV138_6533 [Kribbella voronezhensis]|uniref:Uncharacterized protein n=1 Tax=Kribbella voronezhensis TaxID=2512212 RepID=A0A4R7SXP6_9ACTN|nr:hypothetical protein [Kribbella voronezhensis]TDU84064.1 hypothetical protein EV138_6533 [Kribbella voronezhensis]